MRIPLLKPIVFTLSLLAAALPCAVQAQMAQTPDVEELRAQTQKNIDEARALQTRLDKAEAEMTELRLQRQRAMTASFVTAIVALCAMGVVLVFFMRNKSRSQDELKSMNERLNKQWEELRKANEELTRVNKELSTSLEKLSGQIGSSK